MTEQCSSESNANGAKRPAHRPAGPPTLRTSHRLDANLIAALRYLAALSGRTQTDIIAAALRSELTNLLTSLALSSKLPLAIPTEAALALSPPALKLTLTDESEMKDGFQG